MRSTLRKHLRQQVPCGVAAWVVLAIVLSLFGIGSAPAVADTAPAATIQVSAPSSAAQGTTISLVATVTGDSLDGVPTGNVVFSLDGGPISPSVTLTAVSDTAAQATLSYSISASLASGPHAITATYVPSDWTTGFPSVYPSVSTVAPAVIDVSPVAPPATAVHLTSDPNPVVPGQPATFTATVTALDGSGTPRGTVTFDDNGTTTLGSVALVNGVATLPGVTGFVAGENVITASYTGNDASSRTTLSFTLPTISVKFTSHLSVTILPSPNIHAGDTVTAVATVTRDGPGTPAPALVTFLVDGQSPLPPIVSQVQLGADGTARVTLNSFNGTGDHVITASYVGSETDDASHGDATVSVFAPGQPLTVGTRLEYGGATTGDYGDTTTLSAKLLDDQGSPVAGQLVTLSLGTSQSCSATTRPDGLASCDIDAIELAPGAYPLRAVFTGDTPYAASSTPDGLTFTVDPEATNATVVATGPVASGKVILSGTVSEDGLGLAHAGVTLSLGDASCSTSTDTTGAASCEVNATTLGPVDVGIVFAGNADYLASSASVTGGALVYAWAPGGGAFVVGDRSATGSVTFWGAKWAKANQVSGGAAPAAFKGFAAKGTTKCNVGWTTDAGNSAPPPGGPLPAYMAVLATDSVTKSGSAIAGSTVHIVVVKTDAGYRGDPGHAGTGTVVATVC